MISWLIQVEKISKLAEPGCHGMVLCQSRQHHQVLLYLKLNASLQNHFEPIPECSRRIISVAANIVNPCHDRDGCHRAGSRRLDTPSLWGTPPGAPRFYTAQRSWTFESIPSHRTYPHPLPQLTQKSPTSAKQARRAGSRASRLWLITRYIIFQPGIR